MPRKLAVGDISIEMEKVLPQMPNSNGSVKAEKVLELNAEHKVIDKIKGLYETDKDLLKSTRSFYTNRQDF